MSITQRNTKGNKSFYLFSPFIYSGLCYLFTSQSQNKYHSNVYQVKMVVNQAQQSKRMSVFSWIGKTSYLVLFHVLSNKSKKLIRFRFKKIKNIIFYLYYFMFNDYLLYNIYIYIFITHYIYI